MKLKLFLLENEHVKFGVIIGMTTFIEYIKPIPYQLILFP